MMLFQFQDNHAAFERLPMGLGGKFYGVYPALVNDIKDPDGQGRVKVILPWSPDGKESRYEAWARIATMMGGNNRGTWFIPDVNDEVLVCFEAGNPRRPYVVGTLWNGNDAPPEQMDGSGQNNVKTIRSRNGVTITMDDSNGQEMLNMKTPGGQEITLKDGPGVIEILDSNGNNVRMEASGITVNASAKITITSSGPVEVSTSLLTVNAGMSRFSGTVQADTVLTNSVISASYTPGAGNIW